MPRFKPQIVEVTKEDFKAYRRIQNSGIFNMMTQAQDASQMAGLDIDTWFTIIKQYPQLKDKYEGEENGTR